MKTIKNLSLPYKISLLASALLFLFTAVVCYYTDLRSLTIWTTNFWDAWFTTGSPMNFYEYSARNLYQLDHAMVGSDILIYIPWAIWNLPIWALQHFGNMAVLEHPLMLLYSKSFLILLLLFSVHVTHKIMDLLTNNKQAIAECTMLYATSFFVVTGIAYIGQNDILVILLFLLALYQYLKGHTVKFVLLVALSVALKPFFIFSYIALVLYKEKKLHKILLYFMVGMSFYVLQKIPFINAPMYQESLSYGPTSNVLGLLLDNTLSISPVGVSIFVLALLVVYIMAYLDSSETDSKQRMIYYCVLPLICFFAFTNYECYRPIYLFVVFYLLMVCKPTYKRMNLLLEIVVSSGLIYYYMVDDFLFYNGIYIHLPAKTSKYDSIFSFLQNHLPSAGLSAIMAVVTFGFIFMAIINHPDFKSENKILCMKEEQYLISLRCILFALPILMAVILKCIL